MVTLATPQLSAVVGATTVTAASQVPSTVTYVLNAKFTIPLIKYNWKSQIHDLLPTWILFCLSGTVTYFFIDKLSILSYFMSILISGLVFMAIAFLGVYLLRKLFFKEIWDLTIKNMHIPLN